MSLLDLYFAAIFLPVRVSAGTSKKKTTTLEHCHFIMHGNMNIPNVEANNATSFNHTGEM